MIRYEWRDINKIMNLEKCTAVATLLIPFAIPGVINYFYWQHFVWCRFLVIFTKLMLLANIRRCNWTLYSNKIRSYWTWETPGISPSQCSSNIIVRATNYLNMQCLYFTSHIKLVFVLLMLLYELIIYLVRWHKEESRE